MSPPPVDKAVPLQESRKKFSSVLRVPIQAFKKITERKFGAGNKGKERDDDSVSPVSSFLYDRLNAIGHSVPRVICPEHWAYLWLSAPSTELSGGGLIPFI